MKAAVGRLDDGAHLGKTIDAHSCREAALADIGAVSEAITEFERCGDGCRVAVDDQRHGGDGRYDGSWEADADRDDGGVLRALRAEESDDAVVLGDGATAEDLLADAGPRIVLGA